MKFLRVPLSGVVLIALAVSGCGGTANIATAPPMITSALTASGTVGSAFAYQITATNSPTGYGATGLPAGLAVNSATGSITGTPTAAGTSTVTLSATNSGGTGNATLTVTIAAVTAAPVITSATTASGTVGSAFSYQITATNSPTSYGATGLPAGLAVNSATGSITGTPTAAGTSTVTLSATNSGGTGNATLTVTIAAVTAPPMITSATTASGTVGSAFSYQITATNSPTSYGATGLPAGLTVNSGTGSITGTPTATGTSTVTLSATNSGGTGNATLTVTIAAAGPVTTSGVTPISGSTAGGTAVTITGTGFAAGVTVTFGGAAATDVAVTSSTTMTASTPTHGSGPVTVTNPGGANGSLTNGFSYAAVLPLKNSANDRYIVDQNNAPWLMMADSPQSMICTIDPSDMVTYMSARASQGFNSINPDAICTTYTGGNSAGTAFDGTPPFTSGSSPANYDLSTPNRAYFTELDQLINLAGSYGFEVILDPIETGGWIDTLENNGTTKAYNYGAYLGNRYKSFPNVMWLSGNDFETWSSSSTDNDLVYQVMAGIASADPNVLQTIELNYLLSYSNQDTLLSSVLTDDGAYTYFETYDCVLQAYASTPTTPAFLIEANYEDESNNGGLPGPTGPYVLREQAYWTLTSGGVGQIWGNHYFWGFFSGWQSQLSSPGALEIQYINQLFDNIAWWELVPDTTHEVVTAGYGTYDGSNLNLTTANYCTTSAAANGSLALTYCPNPSTFTVNLAKFSGPVTAQWYDASDGAYATISGSPFQNNGLQNFTTPGNNHDGDPDWVLVMTVP